MKPIKNKHQLVQIMIKCQWSSNILARLLDVTPRQIRRYVSGESPIPRSVEMSINWLTRKGFKNVW